MPSDNPIPERLDNLFFTLDEILLLFEPVAFDIALNSLTGLMATIDETYPNHQVKNREALIEDLRVSYDEYGKTNSAEHPNTCIVLGTGNQESERLLTLEIVSNATREDEQAIIRIVRDIDAKLGEYEGLSAVCPNWLMMASNGGSGLGSGTAGGPGTYPVPFYPDNDKNIPYQFQFFKLTGKNPTQEYITDWSPSHNCEKEVFVAILDSFPKAEQLKQFKAHVLGDKLSNLTVIDNDEIKDGTVPAYKEKHPKGHDYNMASHGLFSAGIIHSIAPTARIKGFRVLDDNGVGTLASMLRGFEQVLNEPDYQNDKPLVINLSLTMTFPTTDGKGSFLNKAIEALFSDWSAILGQLQEDYENRGKAYQEMREKVRQGISLEEVAYLDDDDTSLARLRRALTNAVQHLKARPNTVLVAAAGNEGFNHAHHPPSLYPAAYTTVIGVAALEKWRTANQVRMERYSCLADAPVNAGFAVYGGNHDPNQLPNGSYAADSENGILGLWVGNLPDLNNPSTAAVENYVGWVRWAGTSFATPIITGALAMLMCKESGASSLNDAVNILRATWAETSSKLGSEVPDVVLAEQM